MTRLAVICISFITISLMFAGIGYAKIDPETCVGMWLLNEAKVDTVKDISGKGNDGTVKSPPKWIDGKFGKAVEFASSGQSIEVPDADSLNFGKESFSVVVWFKFSAAQDWNRLVRERNPSPWGSGNYGWELQTRFCTALTELPLTVTLVFFLLFERVTLRETSTPRMLSLLMLMSSQS